MANLLLSGMGAFAEFERSMIGHRPQIPTPGVHETPECRAFARFRRVG